MTHFGLAETWITHYDVLDAHWSIQYLFAYYWSLSSVSLGYGDVVPITYAEKILTCFLAIYVASLLCYAPCEIGIIYSRFNIKSEKEIK